MLGQEAITLRHFSTVVFWRTDAANRGFRNSCFPSDLSVALALTFQPNDFSVTLCLSRLTRTQRQLVGPRTRAPQKSYDSIAVCRIYQLIAAGNLVGAAIIGLTTLQPVCRIAAQRIHPRVTPRAIENTGLS